MKDKDKIKVKQVIIVEGKYDKIKLDSIFLENNHEQVKNIDKEEYHNQLIYPPTY